MIFHLKHTETITEDGPLASPVEPEAHSSHRLLGLLETHGWDRAVAALEKPLFHAKGPAPDAALTKAVHRGLRTEVLSLVMLTIAVTLLLQMGFFTWVLNETGGLTRIIAGASFSDGYLNWPFVKPGLVLLVSFLTAVVLVAKEFLMRSKAITLTFNAIAALSALCYGALYTSFTVGILNRFALQLMSTHVAN